MSTHTSRGSDTMPEYEALTGQTKKLIVATASSNLGIDELLARISAANRGTHVMQVFDPTMVICRKHIVAAYVNARAAFRDGTNRTRSVAKEMLLYSALTPQISKALARVGIKSTRMFVIFADSDKTVRMLGDAVKVHGRIREECPKRSAALRALEITGEEKTLTTLLEEMAKVRLGMKA